MNNNLVKRHKSFRYYFIGVFLIFFTIGSVNLYFNVLAPYDDNHYINVANSLYVMEEINFDNLDFTTYDKTIVPKNSSIISIDEKKFQDFNELEDFIANKNFNDTLKLTCLINPSHSNFKKIFTEINIRTIDFDISKTKFLEKGLRIIWVKPNGASEQAGLKVGDIIETINGEEFESEVEAQKIYYKFKIGDEVSYEIRRGNTTEFLEVKLTNLGVPVYFILNLIATVFAFGLALILTFKRYYLKQARILAIGMFSVGYILFSSLNYTLFNLDSFAIVVMAAAAINIGILLPYYVISFYYVPDEVKSLINKKWILKIPFIVGILLIVFNIINGLFLKNYLFYGISLQSVITFYWVYGAVIRIIYYKHFSKKRLKETLPISILLTLVFLITTTASILSAMGFALFLPYLNVLLILLPLAYYYMIGRYNLFDLDFRVRRNIRYNLIYHTINLISIAAILLLAIYLITIDFDIPNLHFSGTAIEVVPKELSIEKQVFYEKIIVIILSFLLSITIWYLRRKIVSLIDNVFYITKLDYKKAIQNINKILYKSIKVSELIDLLIEKVNEIVRLKLIGMIIFDNNNSIIKQSYIGLDNKDKFKSALKNSEKDFKLAINNFETGAKVDYLPTEIKSLLSSNNFNYLIPLKTGSKNYGALLFGEKMSESPMDVEDLEFLRTIANQSATSIENSLLFRDLAEQDRIKHELELAQKIQMASLPMKTPKMKHFEISAVSIPAYEVGGDFFDYFIDKNEEIVSVYIGDVSGKGTSAALNMSQAQGIIRTLHLFDLEPSEICKRANVILHKMIDKSSFVSMLGVKINRVESNLTIARAGHLPLVLFKAATKEFSLVKPEGIVLGATGSTVFDKLIEQVTISYEKGDILILLTDGITEAMNRNSEEMGLTTVLRIVSRYQNEDAETIKDKILSAVSDHSEDNTHFDDQTCVVIKVLD